MKDIVPEYKSNNSVYEALDNEEVTRQKVTARLGKLVNAGAVTKETVKVEGARKMGYRAAE